MTIRLFHCVLYLILSKKHRFLEGIYSCMFYFFFFFFSFSIFHIFLSYLRKKSKLLLDAKTHSAILGYEKGGHHHACRGYISKMSVNKTPKAYLSYAFVRIIRAIPWSNLILMVIFPASCRLYSLSQS